MISDAEHARVLTSLLWEEATPDWKALADALRDRGFDPREVAVGDRFSDDPDKEFGVAITREGTELEFVVQFLAKGRVAANVTPARNPSIYSDALDGAQGVLDSMTD